MARPLSRRDLEQYSKTMDSCACLNLRKACRLITRYFDDALRPYGIRQTQMPILVSVAVNNRLTVTELAQQLVMEGSSMTRSLKALAASGFITLETGRGGRTQAIALTPSGLALLKKTLPQWEEAQKQFLVKFGSERWQQLQVLLPQVLDTAPKSL